MVEVGCGHKEEEAFHLLFLCPWAKQVWRKVSALVRFLQRGGVKSHARTCTVRG